MRKQTTIEIVLKSDLCVSSGYAYAGTIDTDVCVDECGFPYIPSKRIKGVMREAAILIGQEKNAINELFGIGGEGYLGESKKFYVSDANIRGMDCIKQEILNDKKKDTVLIPQNILNLFTTVKAQTRINENGVAEEDTLRYMRTVNQYSPLCIDKDQKELAFVSTIEYEASYETQLNNIVCAMRHIGMDRNRGLGNVRCTLDLKNAKEIPSMNVSVSSKTNKRISINYTIKNIAPLMLSASKDDVSEKYISGKNVLGSLASIYLKVNNLKEPDDTFKELFLSGHTIFSDLYITNNENKKFFPAPLYINRLKKSKKYVCVAKKNNSDSTDYNPENGNQPKKLKGKYVYSEGNKIEVLETKIENVYHHSKNQTFDRGRMSDDGTDGILYTMEVLKANQMFSGNIIVDEQYKDIIISLLKSPMMRFGKSKSAEYGSCKLAGEPSIKNFVESTYSLKAGDKVLVLLNSPLIVMGEYGYTTQYEEIMDYISNTLGLKKIDEPTVYMNIGTFTGYNSKMNLKRSSIPTIEAGSAFEFEVEETKDYKANFIGSYISEGFGNIRIIKEQDLSYVQEEIEREELQINSYSESLHNIEKSILKNQLIDALKAKFIEKSREDKNLEISAALTGRITLMLKQSVSLKDFADRIVSIKRKQEREQIIQKLNKWNICKIFTKKEDDLLVCEKVDNKMNSTNLKNILGVNYDRYENLPEEELNGLWEEYLAFILLRLKYSKSSSKKE